MTILLSAQVSEALEELYGFVRDASPEERLVIHAPQEILRQVDKSIFEDQSLTVIPARNVQRSRVLPKSLDLVDFLRIVVRERPRLIASGTSFLKHRLATKVFGTPHVAYIRGLLFNPQQRVGLSDMLRYRIFGGRNFHVLNAFGATKLLTVAEVNKSFMESRGVPPERIELVGPVWLDSIPRSGSNPDGGRVFFVSQPFAVHGDDKTHILHVNLIASLRTQLKSRGIELLIRAHPRDYYSYEEDPAFSGVKVHRGPSKEFLAQLSSSDVLISNLSTMAFEALYLGASVVFYQSPGITDLSMDVYPQIGVTPRTIDEILESQSIEELSANGASALFAPTDRENAVAAFR